jgi:hypothetical protein
VFESLFWEVFILIEISKTINPIDKENSEPKAK